MEVTEILSPDTQSSNALAVLETKQAPVYFEHNGMDPIIGRLREEVEKFKPDISTKKGREEIASFAYKLAKSKTAIDKFGKDLVSGIKEQAKIIDAERARAWEEVEKLQALARKPLTDWENAEKERIDGHEAALKQLADNAAHATTIEAMDIFVADIPKYQNREWQEFSVRASDTIKELIETITQRRAATVKAEEDRIELERHRQEEAARLKKAEEDRIANEAAEKARKEAEEKAAAEIAKVAKEKQEAEEREAKEKADKEATERKAAEEKERADKAIADAAAAAKKAEADKIAAKEKAAADAKAAKEKADADQKKAVEEAAAAERKRIEDENKRKADEEAAATAKREADKAHMAKINNEALNAIVSSCNSETIDIRPEIAKAIISAIAKGLIPHVKITY